MKKLFVFLFLLSSFSFAQDKYMMGVEIVYPSGPGTSDIELNSAFIGNYPGQYQMFKDSAGFVLPGSTIANSNIGYNL